MLQSPALVAHQLSTAEPTPQQRQSHDGELLAPMAKLYYLEENKAPEPPAAVSAALRLPVNSAGTQQVLQEGNWRGLLWSS